MQPHSIACLLLAGLAGLAGGCTSRLPDMAGMAETRTARSLYVPIGDRNRACLYACADDQHYIYAIPLATSSYFHVGDNQFYP